MTAAYKNITQMELLPMDPGRAHDRGLLSRSSSKDYTMMMGLFTPSAWMMLAGFSRRMFKKLRLRMIGYIEASPRYPR